jgi:hypothetical protein
MKRADLIKRTGLCMLLIALAVPQLAHAAISDSEELTQIGQAGTGAGQIDRPVGLASDPVSGHLFVVEDGNKRVSEFTPWGSFVKAFGFDVAPGAVNEEQELRVSATAGSFKLMFEGSMTSNLPFNASAEQVEGALTALPPIGPNGVTVRGVMGTPDGTTPYVHIVSFKGSLAASEVVELKAVDGTPSLDGQIVVRTRANGAPAGVGPESCTAESGCKAGVGGPAAGQLSGASGVTVDEGGNVYLREVSGLRVQKFDAAGRFQLMFGGGVNKTTGADLCTAVSGNECGIGTPGTGSGEFALEPGEGIAFCAPSVRCGPAGAVAVADVGRIQRFSLDGDYLGELAVPGEVVQGLALDTSGDDLYVALLGKGGIRKLDWLTGSELGPPREGSRAMATGRNGELFTTSEVKVVREFDDAGTPLSPSSCCEAALQPPPNETQPFSLIALGTNGAGDLHVANIGQLASLIRVFGPPPLDFEGPPPAPPEIQAQFASSVRKDGARVAALIDPHFFSDTKYYVQYGTAACSAGGCTVERPGPPRLLLSSKVSSGAVRTADIFLEGLTSGVTYYYRFVTESTGGGPVVGPEASFTTPDPLPQPSCPNDVFRGGPSSRLPDCRAYEMVSPVDKNNGDIKTLVDFVGYDTNLSQSAEDGNAFTYSSSRSFGSPIGAPLTNQYMARRIWSSMAINAGQGPGATINTNGDAAGNPYRLFSNDLCMGWFVVAAEPLLDPPRDFSNYQNVYRRDFCGGTGDEALLPEKPTVPLNAFNPELQGVSADGRAAIVRVKDKLTPDAASGVWQTYYAAGGDLKLICKLPDGSPITGHCSGGTGLEFSKDLSPAELNRSSNVTGAISDDGQKVYWTDSGSKESGTGAIYLRIRPGKPQGSGGKCEPNKACTVKVSGTKTPQASRFLAANPDGSKALFEVSAGALAGDLYIFDANSGNSTLIAGEVLGLAAASKDLSRVYFASEEAIAPGSVSGQPNLYLAAGKARTFIATLSKADVAPVDIFSNTAPAPYFHVARTSTDGAVLAFISNRSLTGYDNADLASRVPDSEVYLYEVGTAGPVCISCNPSGARPQGRVVKRTNNVPGSLAAAGLLPVSFNMLYTPRALSADGQRLFFESFDALVPRDVNAAKDVYEWVGAAGRDACVRLGSELYVPAARGCLSLISSGESPEDSNFADASASGDDVFFITNASLVPQDPGLFDAYDARVNGGLASPVPVPECQGETCKPPVTAPNDSTPASSTYSGPGNLKQKTTKKHKHKKGKRHKSGKRHKARKHHKRATQAARGSE